MRLVNACLPADFVLRLHYAKNTSFVDVRNFAGRNRRPAIRKWGRLALPAWAAPGRRTSSWKSAPDCLSQTGLPVPTRNPKKQGFSMPFPRASQALSRFTVLDLTRVRSGPTCVRQLADWGANVIKIDALLEDSGGEQPGGPRQRSDFQNLHRNKRAMTLNLKNPRGLEVFRRLAKKADVIVENFRPDVKVKLGIDYESVRKINPRIVYGSISGFG